MRELTMKIEHVFYLKNTGYSPKIGSYEIVV